MLAKYYHSTPIPLRTHKKSSTGCKACKARKVKVHESFVICRLSCERVRERVCAVSVQLSILICLSCKQKSSWLLATHSSLIIAYYTLLHLLTWVDTDNVQCDEQKPVCGKCAIHFSNITQCDYEHTARKVKKSARPILPKAQQGSPHFDAVSVRSSSSRSSSNLSSSKSGYHSPNTDPSSETASHSTKASASLVTTGQKRPIKSSTIGCKCPCHVPGKQALSFLWVLIRVNWLKT